MICKNCGKELSSEDKFCSRCGSKVEALVEAAFEEVVFNPPFKVENEMREAAKETAAKEPITTEELSKAEAIKRRFDTIDFTWDLSGFPSDKKAEKKATEDIVFDWTSQAAPKQKTEEPAFREVEATETEEATEPDLMFEEIEADQALEELGADQAVAPEIEQAAGAEAKQEEVSEEMRSAADEQMKEYFDDGMPKGNGISVEDFLEELKNHVPREERIQDEEEAEKEEKPEPQNLQERIEQGRKGLKSFFKGAFLEPAEEEPTAEEEPVIEEVVQEEPVAEEEPAVQEEPVVKPVTVVAIEPCCVSPIAVMAPEETAPLAAVAPTEEEPFEEIDVDERIEEINEYLPEDKQETGESVPSADATRIVDKFYTFNKKNVEFQKLLDQEYEKIRGERPIEEVKAEVKQSNQQASNLAKEVLEMKETAKTEQKAPAKAQPNWDEIFKEEEEEEKPKKKGGAGKFFGVLLLIIILVLGGAFGVMKLLPDTQVAKFIEPYYDKGLALVGIEVEKEPVAEDTVKAYIEKQIDNNRHIGEVVYDPALTVSDEILAETDEFKNEGFTKINGNQTNFGEMITAALISHYSADSGSEETITKLAIGDYRAKDQIFYAPCEYTENEKAVKELVKLSLKGDNIIIENIDKI